MTIHEKELAYAFEQWLNVMEAQANRAMPERLKAAVLRLMTAQQDGHVCVALTDEELSDIELWRETPWLGEADEYRPFIIDSGRLYLARYAVYEKRLANILRAKAGSSLTPPVDLTALHAIFEKSSARQKLAAFVALSSRLLVLSGGPGTGKTSTVVNLLALLLSLEDREWKIAMAAPTGKAAQRLGESIRSARDRLPVSEQIKSRIPVEAQTLHRLLGAQGDTGRYRHTAENPLNCELLIVDEASMVDLAMMSRLMQALPETARVILLGDKDQLASVEAGSVLGDICKNSGYDRALVEWVTQNNGGPIEASESPCSLGNSLVFLDVSHRFKDDSGIGALAKHSREGNAQAFINSFEPFNDIHWQLPDTQQALLKRMEQGYADYFSVITGAGLTTKKSANEQLSLLDSGADSQEKSLAELAFAEFLKFRVLSALRAGYTGVEQLNRLFEATRIDKNSGFGAWYAGRAIMISTNDYSQRLFNGDIGLCLPTQDGLRIFFEADPGEYRILHPGRLPAHEPAWAMTVHKSQGSEFEEVLLVLPDELVPVVNRPLIYTGITRAKKRFVLWSKESVLIEGLAQLPQRESGLAERLL